MLEDGDGIDLVQCYNPRTDMWIEKPNMQIPRSGSAACILGGLIYIIGMTVADAYWFRVSENNVTSRKKCIMSFLPVRS